LYYSHKYDFIVNDIIAMPLASNIKLLRTKKGLTQEAVATTLGLTRSTFNNYENAIVVNPTAEILITISTYFNVSIDVLLKTDLGKFSDKQLEDLTKGYDAYTTGTKIRILATTVDSRNNENNELVNVKASAGYTFGFGDQEFIKKLPMVHLPFLNKERKYRTFQITGDSMYPIPDKSYVVGEYVENMNEIKDGTACIIVTLDDGVVFKIITNHIKKGKTLLLSSLNALYEPYELTVNKVKEVWQFTHYISSQLPEPVMSNEILASTVLKLKREVSSLRK
jgi:transcriptional regulator with XRE-family HTH domain